MKLKTWLILASALLALPTAAADWSSTAACLLYGSGYQMTASEDQTILTLEHASGWTYGDNFFFFDIGQPFDMDTTVYGEWHPRLSLGKMTRRNMGFGFVKDVLIATELNVGEGWRAYLYGVGFDLTIPHFQFFALNLFIRDEIPFDASPTFQISPSWNLPFTLGSARFEFRGFLDYAGSHGDGVAHLLMQPQLLLDLGHFSSRSDKLYAGIEYQYWNNKYGVDGVKDNLVQIMGKWVF